MATKFQLNALFKQYKFEDSVVIGMVGRPLAKSDYIGETRKLIFEFFDEKSAKKAMIRLKKSDIRAEIEIISTKKK